jgi:hypothetical protein
MTKNNHYSEKGGKCETSEKGKSEPQRTLRALRKDPPRRDTRPPRLKAKPMAGRRIYTEKILARITKTRRHESKYLLVDRLG